MGEVCDQFRVGNTRPSEIIDSKGRWSAAASQAYQVRVVLPRGCSSTK